MALIPSFSNVLLEYFSGNRIKGVDELEAQLGLQPLTAAVAEERCQPLPSCAPP